MSKKLEEWQDDPKTIWKIFPLFGACRKMGSIESALNIKVDESVITNEQMISGNLNELFVDVAFKLEQPLKPPDFEILTKFINSKVTDDVSFYISLIVIVHL